MRRSLTANWQRFNHTFWTSGTGAGVDVMITIFHDFRQFSEKKLAFFSKTNVTINFFK
jgi:hypothetical protein